jgi:hypothetical protein
VNVKVSKSYECLQANEKMNSNNSIPLLQEIYKKRSMKAQESDTQSTKVSKGCLKSGRHQCPTTTDCTDSPKFSDSVNGHLGVTGLANDQKVNSKQRLGDTETGTAQRNTNMS